MSAALEETHAPVDLEERARARRRRLHRIGRWALPALVALIVLVAWQGVVALYEIPHYILPGPDRVLTKLSQEWASLLQSWWITVQVAGLSLALAIVVGGGLGVLFSLSRAVEMSVYPYAVVLQVTPVISIAPLIIIYVDTAFTALLICAWIVAFFPILSSTTLGLASADRNLHDLMSIYRVSRWQRLRYLQIPAALPYFLGGLRIAGGLSLIGAVVAEYAIGAAGRGSGLAYRILESGYRLEVDRMFAALLLIMLTGIAIYLVLSLLSHLLLRKWHESAVKRES
ncbi:MAG: ABC transporter permease [Pseudomonadota bacterium]